MAKVLDSIVKHPQHFSQEITMLLNNNWGSLLRHDNFAQDRLQRS